MSGTWSIEDKMWQNIDETEIDESVRGRQEQVA